MRKAASEGARLAVLPEYHLGLPDPKNPFLRPRQGWAKYLDEYCALARECRICIVPGSYLERQQTKEADDEVLMNVTYFIDDEGQIAGNYKKKNLWHPERPFVSSSRHDPHVAFDTPLGKVGLLICWDLAFPEAFRELIAQGAKIIIMPAYWTLKDAGEIGLQRNPLSEQVFIDATVVSRAFENTCAFVFCNAGGPANEGFAGRSQVAMPFLGCVGRIDECEEAMKIVTVDPAILEEAESVYKIREDMTGADWHYVHRKLP